MSRSPKKLYSSQYRGEQPRIKQGEFDYFPHDETVFSSIIIPKMLPNVNANTIEALVRDNAELSSENERLSRLAKQKKSEADLFKQRYETQTSQLIQIKSNYESEIIALQGEVSQLIGKLNEFEYERERQVQQQKQSIEEQAFTEIQYTKKLSQDSDLIADQKMREMRQYIQQQDDLVEDLQAKLLRLKKDDDLAILRLQKENEILRQQNMQFQIDKQEELEELNNQLNDFNEQQIKNLRQEMQNQNDRNGYEINQLKGLMSIKNSEIETLILQSTKSKQQYDEDIEQLRDEIALLKNKIMEQEQLHRDELEQLQDKLNNQYNDELLAQSQHYQNLLSNIEQEYNNLRGLIRQREKDLQQSQDEKQQLRTILENQIDEISIELANQMAHNRDIEQEKNREISEQAQQYELSLNNLQDYGVQQRNQIQFLENEQARLKELLSQKNKELDQEYQQFSLQKKSMDEELRRSRQELDKLRGEFQNFEKNKNNELDELRSRLKKVEQQNREKVRQLEINNEQLELDLKRANEFIDVKKQEIDNILIQKQGLDRELKRSKDLTENQKLKIIQIEREKNQQHEELKQKLEEQNTFQVENLKQAFNTQLQIITEENSQLKQSLDLRKKDIQELLERYEQLQNALKEGKFVQSDLAAAKSIYDVYLKSKKQNKEKE